MRDMNWYIDTAKENSGAKSDRKLSELLGLSNVGVSSWRTKKAYPDDATMNSLCKIAGVDPYVGLLDLSAWRTEGETRKAYEAILKKITVAAFVVLATVSVSSPANAAPSCQMISVPLYIMVIIRGRLRLWVLRLFQPQIMHGCAS